MKWMETPGGRIASAMRVTEPDVHERALQIIDQIDLSHRHTYGTELRISQQAALVAARAELVAGPVFSGESWDFAEACRRAFWPVKLGADADTEAAMDTLAANVDALRANPAAMGGRLGAAG